MGLTGVETLSPMFFSAAHIERGVALSEFARMTASGPAKAFQLWGKKGAIAPGFDADLVFYDASQSWTVRGANFQGLGKWSAFEGMRCQGRVVRTLIRGVTVFQDDQMQVEPGFGQFVTRQV